MKYERESDLKAVPINTLPIAHVFLMKVSYSLVVGTTTLSLFLNFDAC